MGYTKIGPFTNNANPPVNKAFLDPLETFLTSFFIAGQISRIALFNSIGSGAAQNISHGLGATPDFIVLGYSGNFGTAPTQVPYWYNPTSTTVQVVAQNAYFYFGLAIKF